MKIVFAGSPDALVVFKIPANEEAKTMPANPTKKMSKTMFKINANFKRVSFLAIK